MRRITREEIKANAEAHVAYGWAKSPGTHMRDVEWTREDTEIYKRFYEEALARANHPDGKIDQDD